MTARSLRLAVASLSLVTSIPLCRVALAEPATADGGAAAVDAPAALLEVGRAEEDRGHLIEARDVYLRVARLPAAPGEPPAFADARRQAADLASSVADRIPSVRLVLDGVPPGKVPRVAIDGQELPANALDLPRKVNPGKHAVVASLEGFDEARTEIAVLEGENIETHLALVPLGAPSAEPEAAAPAPGFPAPPDRDRSALPLWGKVAFGVGAVGLGVGVVTGVMSLSRASSAKDFCDGDRCTPEARDDIDASKSLATVSNVGFVLAIVGGGVGLYALLTRPSSSAARVEPVLGAGFGGLRGAF